MLWCVGLGGGQTGLAGMGTRRVGALGAKLTRRRKLGAAVRIDARQRGGALLAKLCPASIFVPALRALHDQPHAPVRPSNGWSVAARTTSNNYVRFLVVARGSARTALGQQEPCGAPTRHGRR